jgi:signal transduction histidine kinase
VALAWAVAQPYLKAQRFALLGSMATSLAHEIRNPVAAIRLHGQLLEHHLPKAVGLAGEPPANNDLDGALQRWVATKVQSGSSYKQLYVEVESTLLKHLMQHFDQKPSVLARVLKMNRATLLKKRRHLGLDA